ncbi:MAG: F0F1 ATP synthase subunit B [Prevotellaceae bacterium]|jgi:F-type H+-transporting ATPase subunit b|nr:F0F1 ATP synthase subunit B [Prevotellaceae bacterium]
MELFTPELGLIFWMLIPFLVVFIVLAKFAWPAILKGVETRSKFIEDSITAAKEANERLENIKEEGEKILSQARTEQLQLLSEARTLREKMLAEAKAAAAAEGEKILQKATEDIARAKNNALGEIRAEVAALSVGIAEKVLRKQLDNRQQQTAMIDRMLEEMNINKA